MLRYLCGQLRQTYHVAYFKSTRRYRRTTLREEHLQQPYLSERLYTELTSDLHKKRSVAGRSI